MDVTLHDKKSLQMGLKLRKLMCTDYAGLSGWALNVITAVVVRGGQRESRLQKKECRISVEEDATRLT